MLLIIDANVLIDYVNSDLSVLTLVVSHIGPIYIPSVVLDEVDQLSEDDCENLGIHIIDESVEILLAAGEKRGALSFEDNVCLLLAKENDWTCVSNDRPLRRECDGEGVKKMWGLRLMIELVRLGFLNSDDAIYIAEEIRVSNPRHITEKIIEEFKTKISAF